MLHLDSAHGRRIGIGLVTLTTICFATLDASAKWLVQSLPVLEVVWLRFLAHALITSVLLSPVYGRTMLRVQKPKLQFVRALMLASMTALNFWALQYLQLAQTAAIQFSVPLMIALFSAWFLREHLDWRRWAAIITGFAGVLLVIRPGTQAFHPAILLSVLNAVLYACFNLLTRRMAASESPAATQLMSALGATVVLAPFALAHWKTPEDALSWGLIAACGLFGGFGHYWVAKAHRYASAATLSPFLYQQIIYMLLWGWLLFGQWPDAGVALGAAIVVASGLALLWVEVKRV
ncbi:MAG: DMT family transporter [Burkholderiales bacterium]|jgi:drug/metabolite transporter (DMT)-like permease|nr:DMT family transporter [Burkholderiales bacterium]